MEDELGLAGLTACGLEAMACRSVLATELACCAPCGKGKEPRATPARCLTDYRLSSSASSKATGRRP